MWLFNRARDLVESGFFVNFIDYHSHILPNVDDGVDSLDDALRVLSYYEELGVKRVSLTPHIMGDLYRNSVESLHCEFQKLRDVYNGSVELSLGAEYMLDSGFYDHLLSGELLPLFDNYLLVEISYAVETLDLASIISDIMSAGYFVVLAHPERYLYFDYKVYGKLKERGVLFQLNIPSLAGFYGRRVKDRALKLLDDGMYDMIGSDLHAISDFRENITKIKLTQSQLSKLLQLK